ncbi:hypothetical protein D6C00_02305 [Thiohalobacter thiocyanaticus]|uniref:Uncharacterized protein n=1 Tax=Thiohalobacter thiocyanaticus TaxID=585455 RepID=A0A426QGQ2_9GAMM|nr:hypothetical protein D6C00_02305 [Thiohalobacter thiocyanaticus]
MFQIQVEQEEKFVSLSVQAMQENKSDIPLQILERRSNEKLCMLELQCYGTQEPMVQGLIFGECLKRMEQESNG